MRSITELMEKYLAHCKSAGISFREYKGITPESENLNILESPWFNSINLDFNRAILLSWVLEIPKENTAKYIEELSNKKEEEKCI